MPSQFLTAATVITALFVVLLSVMLFRLRLRAPLKALRVAALHAIGTANPSACLGAADFLRICDTLGYPPELREKMGKIVGASGIETRFPVCPSPPEGYVAALDEVGARGALWEGAVPALAVAAARQALAGWRHGSACDVTHVVVHSCTGFAAPGIDFALIKALGLPSTTRKLGVNFMGCFGGMTALYVAKQIIEADATGRAVVLVACAEACTVHVSAAPRAELAVGNSIFGDGAAAALVTHVGFRGTPPPPPAVPAAPFPVETADFEWELGAMASDIAPDSEGAMTWRQSAQAGRYDMWLARDIPDALKRLFGSRGLDIFARVGLNPFTCAFALHPGGKAILAGFEAVLGAMGAKVEGIDASKEVLRQFGNMSSATIFFVLQRVLSSTKQDNVFFAGFGPGALAPLPPPISYIAPLPSHPAPSPTQA